MTIAQYDASKYPQYIAADVMSADVVGDWIRLPVNAVSATFDYDATDVDNPVGVVGVDVSNLENPDADAGHPLTLEGDVDLDGVGAKKDYVKVGLQGGRFEFIRFKYTRTSDGTGDTMNVAVAIGSS